MDSVGSVRNRWLRSGAIKLHVALALILPVMVGLGWWQLQRALVGHTRSWAYAIQWPAFGAYAVYVWWKLLREQPGFDRHGVARRPQDAPDDDEGPGPRHITRSEGPPADAPAVASSDTPGSGP